MRTTIITISIEKRERGKIRINEQTRKKKKDQQVFEIIVLSPYFKIKDDFRFIHKETHAYFCYFCSKSLVKVKILIYNSYQIVLQHSRCNFLLLLNLDYDSQVVSLVFFLYFSPYCSFSESQLLCKKHHHHHYYDQPQKNHHNDNDNKKKRARS